MGDLWTHALPVLVASVIVCCGWVIRSRGVLQNRQASMASNVSSILEDEEEEEARQSLKRFEAFRKLKDKFIREVKTKVEKFGDANRTQGVLDKLSTLEVVFDQEMEMSVAHMEMSVAHMEAFLGLWRETMKIGVKLSKDHKDLKDQVTRHEETITRHEETITRHEETIRWLKGTATDQRSLITSQQNKMSDLETSLREFRHEVTTLRKETKDVTLASLKAHRRRWKHRLLYSDWIRRLDELVASILNQPWEQLSRKLKLEEKSGDPWNEPEHIELYEKVLKTKVKLDKATWAASGQYQGRRNDKVHNGEITKSEGLVLRRRLCKDFQRIQRSSLEPYDKAIMESILPALHQYFFPAYSIHEKFEDWDTSTVDSDPLED